ncbi:hypothetical protein [Pseudomonas oryzihabitans]|uniref:hypothetical protein n=1 Tax=Pseudomonas oryzihabitans TaxID=47885 RepID=UPI002857D877|nr:hypothetical protein [Pseudomonas psychrotolerans]MDR6677101.1 hypothetical protein [Pseudomonas psychrotolerans]
MAAITLTFYRPAEIPSESTTSFETPEIRDLEIFPSEALFACIPVAPFITAARLGNDGFSSRFCVT